MSQLTNTLLLKLGRDPLLCSRYPELCQRQNELTTGSATVHKAGRPVLDPLPQHLVRRPSRPRSMPSSPRSLRRACITGPNGMQYLIASPPRDLQVPFCRGFEPRHRRPGLTEGLRA
ncbi:hypothetical protein PoB_005892500 [Plakobranchus ocellatus]|uniref:Uncharacterized protein n=1 Tax=Plakobranchus ocellatus TaxID=259542 RepID=A0AAV4CKM4_9GAST|nr:hypothetical protein PoB_005892500 [Plakobranchus ocellatus]